MSLCFSMGEITVELYWKHAPNTVTKRFADPIPDKPE